MTVNDRPPIQVAANPAGSDRAIPGPHGARKHGFTLPFSPPLSTTRDQRITAAFAETGRMLMGGEASIPAVTLDDIKARLFPTNAQPLKSMFVVCAARSGSSLLMRRLAAHPNIVAAKNAIHEVRMTYYYAEVLRVLTSPGNHEHSTRPELLGKGGYVVGSNPFYHPRFERAFATTDARDFFFQSVVFRRLKSALRDVVGQYYRFIAADNGKHDAVFFVEKLNMPKRLRRMALSLFPEAKQLLLVRDMRDVLCSQKNYFKRQPERSQESPATTLQGSARHLVEIARRGGPNIVVVKYEDLVLREQQTLERLFGSIGLDYVPVADADGESRLFSRHATSKSPAASIGRWKADLTDAEQAQANDSFKEFLETFEYA